MAEPLGTDPSSSSDAFPERVKTVTDQVVEYVRRALGVTLEFDSDTLPVLDHYLRTVPQDQPSAVALLAVSAGTYFGEVVRRVLGARWQAASETPSDWRIVLPTGLSFSPAGVAAETILQDDKVDLGSRFETPEPLRPHVEQALARMGEVSVEEYYSLCGRLDTLEHVQAVLLATAAGLAAEREKN